MKKKSKVLKTEIKRGTKHEMEHTKSKKVAKKIAIDHLQKHPLYYNEKVGLSSCEKKMKKAEKSIIRKKK